VIAITFFLREFPEWMEDALAASSRGQFDAEEYQRQLVHGCDPPE
jgi:hypothetical protein